MVTNIIKIINVQKSKKEIQKAAEIIKRGGLVAFPRETIYGLGANALDPRAIRKIFKAKGRPLDNPLIIHIADYESIFKMAKREFSYAQITETLVKKFWPGPLTLILFKKKKIIPDEVTANLNIVALRMPKNKIALELIKMAEVPIAAPSANLAGRPSPTTAQHVFEDLRGKIDLILDGGSTEIGVESTILDLTIKPPLILRPGGISLEELKKVLPDVKIDPNLLGGKFKEKAKSPGMKYRHYAPKAPLILVNSSNLKERLKKIEELIDFYQKEKKEVGLMISQETKNFLKRDNISLVVGSRKNLKEISHNLFAILRKFDRMKVDIILAETFSEKGIGCAIMHRLKRAAGIK